MTIRNSIGNDVLDELRDSYLRDIESEAGTNDGQPGEDDALEEVFDLLRSTNRPATIQPHDEMRPSAGSWQERGADALANGNSDPLSSNDAGAWEWGDGKAPVSRYWFTPSHVFGGILSEIVTPGTIFHLLARVVLALLALWFALAYVVPAFISMLMSALMALMPALIMLVGIALCIKSVFR